MCKVFSGGRLERIAPGEVFSRWAAEFAHDNVEFMGRRQQGAETGVRSRRLTPPNPYRLFGMEAAALP